MDAIIFDFDGVLVDSEPVHLRAFREILTGENISLTDAMYFERYLGYDDHDCFAAVAHDFDRAWDEAKIAELTQAKSVLVQAMIAVGVPALPGAVELIRSASEAGVPMGICSGALGDEVRQAAEAIGVIDCMGVIVAAEDVENGKPHPEGYLKAARLLGEKIGLAISPAQCVVCEDSPAGIAAGQAAGMCVLGLTTSYPAEDVADADQVVANLAAVTLDDLRALAERRK